MINNLTHTLRLRHCVIAGASCLAIALLAGDGLGFTQDEAAQEAQETKLSAVLPEAVPAGLTVDDFGELGPNWATWSEETANLIGDLYELKDLNAQQQQDILAKLGSKVRTMDKALADQQYAMIHDDLRVLRQRLSFRVNLINALNTAVNNQPEALPEAVGAAYRSEVAEAVAGLQDFLAGVTSGEAWTDYLSLEAFSESVTAEAAADDAQAAMKAYQEKLAGLGDASEEQQRFAARFAFQRVSHAIEDYMAFLEGGDGFYLGQFTNLMAAIEGFESGNGRVDASRIRRGLRVVPVLAPSGGADVAAVIRDQYFADNMHVSLSEKLLDRVISTHKTESGRVADCILGAWVTGCQVSDAKVSVNVVPSSNNAKFQLNLNGTSNTNTQGRKDPATVYTRGRHYFSGTKSVTFTGTEFVSSQTHLSVDANNHTVGLETDYDWIPLIGLLARGIAQGEVRRSKAESELIAAQKLSREVIPKFDSEVDGRFDDANADLESKLFSNLRKHDLYPASLSTRSTSSHIGVSSRTMDDSQLGAGAAPVGSVAMSGISAQIHETLINNALDRMPIAGKALTEDELKSEIETAIGEILSRDFSFDDQGEGEAEEGGEGLEIPESPTADTPAADGTVPTSAGGVLQDDVVQEADPAADAGQEEAADEDPQTTFIFDSLDPVRVRIVDGGMSLVLRMGIQEEGKDPIAPQEITVPITLDLQGETLVVEADRVRTRPLTRGGGSQLAVSAQINRILGKRLPRREVDMSFEVPIEGKEPISLSVSHFAASNGWLTIVAQ